MKLNNGIKDQKYCRGIRNNKTEWMARDKNFNLPYLKRLHIATKEIVRASLIKKGCIISMKS